MKDSLFLVFFLDAWCGAVQDGHKSTHNRKGTESQECPWVFSICQGTRSTFFAIICDPCDVHCPFQVCCAHVSITFSIDSSPVESRQNLANGNLWIDQKEKTTHLYNKAPLHLVLRWQEAGLNSWTEIGLIKVFVIDSWGQRTIKCDIPHQNQFIWKRGVLVRFQTYVQLGKRPSATFFYLFYLKNIVSMCAYELYYTWKLFSLSDAIFLFSWIFPPLIPWWYLTQWSMKEKESRPLRCNLGGGGFL